MAGEWTCPEKDAGADAGEPVVPNLGEPIRSNWSTGFEREFCDFTRVHGFCYADPDASYEVVSSPVHKGKLAVAFHVTSDNRDARQARCVRQGVFPKEAYYSAYYLVPAAAKNSGNWNLFHFQGGEPSNQDGLWDVSLASDKTNGELSLYIRELVHGSNFGQGETPAIPIGAWFKIEVYLRRASDGTGEIALYQDGARVVRVTDVSTDHTTWGQWYVGNLADGLDPPESTVYVDDVAIRENH